VRQPIHQRFRYFTAVIVSIRVHRRDHLPDCRCQPSGQPRSPLDPVPRSLPPPAGRASGLTTRRWPPAAWASRPGPDALGDHDPPRRDATPASMCVAVGTPDVCCTRGTQQGDPGRQRFATIRQFLRWHGPRSILNLVRDEEATGSSLTEPTGAFPASLRELASQTRSQTHDESREYVVCFNILRPCSIRMRLMQPLCQVVRQFDGCGVIQEVQRGAGELHPTSSVSPCVLVHSLRAQLTVLREEMACRGDELSRCLQSLRPDPVSPFA
jgi:hypothetical protein